MATPFSFFCMYCCRHGSGSWMHRRSQRQVAASLSGHTFLCPCSLVWHFARHIPFCTFSPTCNKLQHHCQSALQPCLPCVCPPCVSSTLFRMLRHRIYSPGASVVKVNLVSGQHVSARVFCLSLFWLQLLGQSHHLVLEDGLRRCNQ